MAQPFCPRCGTAQDPANVFCPKCGARLPGEEGKAPAPQASPRTEAGSGTEANAAKSGTVADDLWVRLRAEEQEYSRRSKRNARMGCLLLLVLIVGFFFAVWWWGPMGR